MPARPVLKALETDRLILRCRSVAAVRPRGAQGRPTPLIDRALEATNGKPPLDRRCRLGRRASGSGLGAYDKRNSPPGHRLGSWFEFVRPALGRPAFAQRRRRRGLTPPGPLAGAGDAKPPRSGRSGKNALLVPVCGTSIGAKGDSDTGGGLLSRRGVACGTAQHALTIGVPSTHGRAKPLPLHCPVDGRAGDAEQVGELSAAVLPRTTQSNQVRFLPVIAGNLHHSGGCAVGSTTSAARNSFATTSTTGTIASGMTNAQRR